VTTEPQRLQYLEAMGVTAWVARYQLPNARLTEVCEWPLPEQQHETAAPAERLHALLDEAEAAPQRPATPDIILPTRGTAPRRARELLGLAAGEDAQGPDHAAGQGTAETPQPLQEPLRFALQIACVAQRWLIVLPGGTEPEAIEQQLLDNLLQSEGIGSHAGFAFESFRWPLIEGQSVEAPQEEARAGLRAFIEGTHRRGWVPERLLLFGTSAALEPLGLAENGADWMGLPVWQGPALAELAHSAEAKRALWPTLLKWRQQWQGDTPEPDTADA